MLKNRDLILIVCSDDTPMLWPSVFTLQAPKIFGGRRQMCECPGFEDCCWTSKLPTLVREVSGVSLLMET